MDTQTRWPPGAKQFATALLGVVIAQSAMADGCPINECNYLDPQFKAAFAQYSSCVNNITTNYDNYMHTLAVLHPRFGIAWNAFQDEVKAALHADGTVDNAGLQTAKQRFDDRILRTAEPEALEWFNLYVMKMRANPLPCGTMPMPPKGQPAPG
jgi:hypothetical protein